MRLKNKAVVVTGASSTLGRFICDMFSREGARVLAVAMGSVAFAKKPGTYCNKPFPCPLIYDPVLCADGVLYSNICFAERVCAPEPCRPVYDPIY